MTLSCKTRVDDGKIVVLSPSVGIWSERPAVGQVVRGGQLIGAIEVLGRRHPIAVPHGVEGAIVGGLADDAQRHLPVDHGSELLVLDPELAGSVGVAEAESGPTAASGLGFKSPSSGRFWRRPSPNDPPLVEEGQVIDKGHAVGLLEVMKTFTRLAYDGPGLPDRARVVRIIPADGDDVDGGDVLLKIEPA
jgi:acetyl-CoA carboxylase biotin carboxyl carrier protein